MADSSDEEGSINLTGFLFGNINERGELEDDDILDEESRKHLAQLSCLSGIGSLVKDITDEDRPQDESAGDRDAAWMQKDSDARDFSDISELAEEEEGKSYTQTNVAYNLIKPSKEDSDDDYDGGDEMNEDKKGDSLILPTVAPAASTLSKEEQDRLAMPPPPEPVIQPATSVTIKKEEEEEEEEKDNLPRTSSGQTVTELFPEFKPGKVLRFSRLFGPGKSLPQQWRNAKRRRKKKKKQEDDGVAFHPPHSPPLPRKEDCLSDDEDKLMAPWKPKVEEQENSDAPSDASTEQQNRNKLLAWRYGPAALWYEMLGVNEDGSDLDYGFKVKENSDDDIGDTSPSYIPEDCFHMVSQVNWEDDIIWSPEEVKPNLQAMARAGWIPTATTRTAYAYASQQQTLFNQLGLKHPGLETFFKNTGEAIKNNQSNPTSSTSGSSSSGTSASSSTKKSSKWYSIFPVENDSLVNSNWEDKIIWDAEAMQSLPSPTVMQLDPNDENIILGIPDDYDPEEKRAEASSTPKKDTKKSKLLLGKNNNKNEDEMDQRKDERIDKFNLSNDRYYSAKHTNVESSLEAKMGSNLVQHSLPAIELQRPYFPTYMSMQDLRNFHKPQLKKPYSGQLSKPGRHVVHGLLKHIKKKAREREKERLASGGGEMFFMRTPADLTGMDGELVLFEYSEEHPALIMAVGMNTRIRNYYKRRPGKDDSVPSYTYGEPVPVYNMSPFLGHIKPGESLQALENNLFRVPIYEHTMPFSDFLIIRSTTGYFVREIKSVFTIGQLCPKFEVPGPNSKKANIHARDFLQVFIYRLFWKSQDDPRRIKMDDIKRAFPSHSESSIRKRLKLCADFKRTGDCCNWWVLKNDFRLPSEEEMRAMVSPEQACAYYSMQAAEQRLKDAGYGEKSLFSCEDDNDDDQKIDDEIRMAPWNTTRAFISAMRGKCQLAVTGSADPTGCGEGFSYIRVPNKPMANKDDSAAAAAQIRKQKTVTGTDADLRRLSLKQARQVLRDFGVSDEEIKKLSRWEVIDVVRTMSTEAAKSGEEGMSKFARGSRFTIAEHQERYKEECQRIFDLQNRVLSSKEELSTDEGSSSEEESDMDELGKNLESMLANKKTSVQLTHEEEEAERRELQKMLSEDKDRTKDSKDNGKSSTGDKSKDAFKKSFDADDDATSIMSCESSNVGRKLVIQRVFKSHEGREFVRREVVKNQAVIDAYLRIVNKDKNIRAQFASVDEVHKEEIRREKRRIQEQLRRIRRNQEKEKMQPVKKKKEKPASSISIKLKCGACGEIGHMRTNKNCPLYQDSNPASVSVAMTDEQVAEEESNMPQDDLVKVEGTKITLGKAFLDQTNELKRKSLVLRFPKESVRKKRRSGVMHCDYLKRPHKSINRRRANPEVALQLLLEQILNKMKEVDESWPFHTPVSSKNVPDYNKIVKNPMDLQTMRENLRHHKYLSREDFIEECSLMVSNSVLYNGPQHQLTGVAQKMLDVCTKSINEKEEEFLQIEKEINPLLGDDALAAFSWILENIVAQIKTVPESWPFHKPVNAKQVPDYYEVVKNPMDIETLRQQVQDGMYRTQEEFMEHVKLLFSNSVLYNGEHHEFSKTAKRIVESCEEFMKEHEDQLTKLENEVVSNIQDDASSYNASEPPSVLGLESMDNSMDGFPDTSKEEDSLLEQSDINEDSVFKDDLQPTKIPPDSDKQGLAAGEDEEMIDVEGYEDGESIFRSIANSQAQNTYPEQQSQIEEFSMDGPSETLDSILLQDLQHSDSENDSDDEDEDDDFPFGDGEEEGEEEEEEEEQDLFDFSPVASNAEESMETNNADDDDKDDN